MANGGLPVEIEGHDTQFNFESSFRFMTERRLQRRYRGIYKQYSFTAQLATWIIVLYTLSVMATLAFGASYTATSDTSVTSDSVFYFAVILFVVYLFVKVALIIRWIVYWVIVAAMLGYALTGDIASVFWLNDDKLTSTQQDLRNIVVILLLVAECLTIAVYVFTHYTYPWLVLNNKFDSIRWWTVQRHPVKGNTITYLSKARSLYTKKRNTISYCGGLDDERRPHGYGAWSDSSFHGERLTGQWEHGIPVGPFRSFEHGSGYCFVDIRIGYCHNRAEEKPEKILFWPKHASDGIHWGVASVECSVSGGFFTFLPSVRHLTSHNGTSDDTPKSAADCVPLLLSPTDSVTYDDQDSQQQAHKNTRPTNKRFQSAKRLLFKESSCPIIDVDAHVGPARGTEGKEALILLHGYNCSLNYGMNRLAQLLALGDFPTNIHPFVFSWPSGGVLAYFQAKSVGSQSDETAAAFRDFLKSLVDAGYSTIHILAHSMGSRVYFQSLKNGWLDEVFELDENLSPDDDELNAEVLRQSHKARLATLTLTNADYERYEFVKRGGTYDKSRRFCRCITVYADNMDGALFYSEIFSKETVFGPLNYSLGKRGHMMHRDPGDMDDELPVMGDAMAGTASGTRQHHNLSPSEMDLAIALVNQRGHFDGVTSFASSRPRQANDSPEPENERSRHAALTAPHPDEEQLEYLDIDVIDTTWMDNNVHAIRHNYFNLNPTVVEDLRCLVVEKQRAASRPGLLKTIDNVYIFLVAPSHIKNQ